ncbi:site-specific integrase [Halostagnicola sp. A56]|uniref:site-specific integrase n=1 Tax=Halostagnicola sp. A56 TaxID=1495067 RepID=UPI0004A01BC1|nr:site-specific integrase [Halostagnicola sp. A56]
MPTADYEAKVDSVFEMVEESDTIHPENADLLRAYRRDKELNGMSAATQQRNLSYLKIVAEHVDKTRFQDMDTEDVKTLIEWVHDRDLADATVETYKKVIRQFWTWMNNGDAPDEVAWLTISSDASSGTLPQDLLTKNDIEDQIAAAKNPRDKAFIAVLYETGARIGELIDLTIGDIEDRKHGKKIIIDGKTGARRLPLVESVPYLNKWLNAHPNPQKNAPLWCKIQQGDPDDQLGYNYLRQKVLQKNMERADIDKPSNPHHYRHSRASYLANEMTEAQLCEWFGWVQGSDVPARYVHLSGRDIDNAYDTLHGLYEPDENEEEPQIIECPRCEELNEHDAAFCMRCGQALDIDAAEELEQAESKVTKVSSDTDAALAIQLVKAIREDKENVAQFIEQLE